ARADDREATAILLAVEDELQFPIRDRPPRVGGLGLGLPGAPVPDDHVARAVLLGRDHSLEIEVLDRVVLDVDRHPPGARILGQALRDRPADEDALDLEAEVVVEAGRAMALDDEATSAAGGRRRAGRLGGQPEVALLPVLV